jgi:hypothetical protein
MNDVPNEPRFDEPRESVTRQVAADDWSRAEIESQYEPPPPRERLFSRRVLIGWALVAVAIYFGVGIVRTVIKESVKAAVSSAKGEAPRDRDIIYRSPNGKVTISRTSPNGPIIITTDTKVVRPTPTGVTVTDRPAATSAPTAPRAPTAVQAPTAPTAPPAKR